VPEIPEKPFFFTQTVQKCQVAFMVLSTEIPRAFIAMLKVETKAIRHNLVLGEHRTDDLRDGLVLKNSLVDAVPQVVELRHKFQLIVGKAALALPL
jgi:hypothetical protein